MEIYTDEIKKFADLLNAGDTVYLSGEVFTARDAVHKRLMQFYKEKRIFPVDLKDKIIYYCGPTPVLDSGNFGSAGPTTSKRMDVYTPLLMKQYGLAATIGKGQRSQDVIDAIVATKGIYFCTYGGLGAMLATHIVSFKTVAFEELGCESLKVIKFNKFPVIVGIDSKGNKIV